MKYVVGSHLFNCVFNSYSTTMCVVSTFEECVSVIITVKVNILRDSVE